MCCSDFFASCVPAFKQATKACEQINNEKYSGQYLHSTFPFANVITTCGLVGLDLNGTTIVSCAVPGSSAMFPLFIVSSAENTIFVNTSVNIHSTPAETISFTTEQRRFDNQALAKLTKVGKTSLIPIS